MAFNRDNPPPPNTLCAIAAVIGFAVAGYFWATYSGPYAWLAELQIKWIGQYYPLITFFVVGSLFAALPATVIAVIIAKRDAVPPEMLNPLVPPPVRPRTPPDAEQAPAVAEKKPLRSINLRHIPFTLLGIAAMLAGMGGWQYLAVLRAGKLIPVDAADFEAGRRPSSNWVQISGRAVVEASIVFTEGNRETHYMPVISPAWRPGQRVAVFAEVKPKRANGMNGLPVEIVTGKPLQGMIALSGLPGAIRTRFAEAGVVPADNYVLLEVGWDPAQKRQFGAAMLGGSGAVLLIAIGVWLYRRRRDRPAEES